MVFVDTSEYLYAVLGGVFLGLSSCLNYIFIGKMTGMSGILYGIVSLNKQELAERLTIVAGMFLTSGIFFDVFGYSVGQAHGMIPFGSRENVVVGTSFIGFALAGFFVGFGTKLSNGCTSGHGLCGLARLNLRSAVAVCSFMVAAMAIASLGYYFTLGPISDQKFNPIVEIDNSASANAIIALGVLLPIVSYLISRSEENFDRKSFFKIQVVEYCVGILFGVGLLVSGLTRRAKVMRFLQLGADWDPSLLFVMAVGGLFNLVIFTYVTKKRKQPVLTDECYGPMNSSLDWKLVVGAIIFGLGWGIGFLCPGPFLVLFSVFSLQVQVVWGVCCILGMFLANWLATVTEKKIQDQPQEQPKNQQAYQDHSHLQVPESSNSVPESSQLKITPRKTSTKASEIQLRVENMDMELFYV